MKSVGSKPFWLLFLKLFIGRFKLYEAIIEITSGVDGVANNNSVVIENAPDNNYLYLYKANGQSENYLNYRAVYGLRYKPTKKPTHSSMSFTKTANHNIVSNIEDSELNGTTFKEVISANKDETLNMDNIYETPPSSIESEITPHSETSAVTSPNISEALAHQNYTFSEEEPVVDESRKHIMRPNNRVEESLEFLAERLKKLLYHSADKSRPESKLSPHLSSLGRFLSLFTLIRLENLPCLTAKRPLRQLSGTCYNEVECASMGGIAVDRCANGFGVCCVCK
jgi:hypothetical protein